MREFKKIPNNPQSELVFKALKHISSTSRVHKAELLRTRAMHSREWICQINVYTSYLDVLGTI